MRKTGKLRRVGLALVLLPGLGSGAAAQELSAGGGWPSAAAAACETDLARVNQIAGWQVRWADRLLRLPVGTVAERRAAIAFWAGVPDALRADRRSLERSLVGGGAAPRAVVRRVLEQIDGLLGLPPETSPLWSPAVRSDDPKFARTWEELVRDVIRPAIVAQRNFLAREYLPAARTSFGLSDAAGGPECFTNLVEAWTTLHPTTAEIERLGHELLAELEKELLRLAAPEYGRTVPEVLASLRALEPDVTGEELLELSRAALARAGAAVGDWIGAPGETSVVAVPMPEHLRGSFPAGFYARPGAPGEPGRYVVNLDRPGERRLMAEVIAFHEGVPGHHTSFAAATGSGRYNGGFVEGWAVYAERLAQDMGVYGTRLDEIGLVTKHLWAASRLVVEPGIHVRSWSRGRAIDFMLAHTALPRVEIELEVDRYAGLPAQSLSYVLGYLHLRDLRTMAEARLGARFDVRDFHDVILREGSRPLPDVSRDVEEWIGGRESRRP